MLSMNHTKPVIHPTRNVPVIFLLQSLCMQNALYNYTTPYPYNFSFNSHVTFLSFPGKFIFPSSTEEKKRLMGDNLRKGE